MYIIETQKVLDLKINLMASYVIVPQMGFYDPKHNLIILDLGHFQVIFCDMVDFFSLYWFAAFHFFVIAFMYEIRKITLYTRAFSAFM